MGHINCATKNISTTYILRNESEGGLLESEYYFESLVTLVFDDEVGAYVLSSHKSYLTGFAAFKDSKAVIECKDMRVDWFNVLHIEQEAFESALYSAAIDKAYIDARDFN